jgi:hypothetical protein
MIESEKTLVHWNYLLALESDLEKVARYIELTKENFKTYSIELAHLLLATSSEVDVVTKSLCEKINPNAFPEDINDYRKIIKEQLPCMIEEKVFIDRYGLTLHPWENWREEENPDWWRSCNKVKHERSSHFEEANLENALNAMAGLLVVIFYFYKQEFTVPTSPIPIDVQSVTERLRPKTKLLRLSSEYYHELLWY